MFGDRYVQYSAMIFLVATVPIWGLLRSVFGIALVAMRKTSDLFIGGLFSSGIGIVLGYAALIVIGAPAAAAIPVAASAIKALWLGYRWRQL
jgi:O-antigen/teichoic acid export membrane protein